MNDRRSFLKAMAAATAGILVPMKSCDGTASVPRDRFGNLLPLRTLGATNEKVTIHGIVLPETWLDNGEIDTLAIVTYSEEKYLVMKSKNAEKLKRHVRMRVVVDGLLPESEDKKIEILKFHLDTKKPGLHATHPE